MAIPHIILFIDAVCSGNHTHICEDISDLESSFSGQTSSFIILEGNWRFFAGQNYQSQMGNFAQGHSGTLGPGVYNWIEDANALGAGTNDQLVSLSHD